MPNAITILTHDDRWKGLRPTVKRAVEAALSELSSLRKQRSLSNAGKGDSCLRRNDKIDWGGKFSLAILLTDDAEVRALNRDYRGKNKPTNVLSFPDGSEDMGADGKRVHNLGDIVLAYETILREAMEQDKKVKDHITHLTIHGVLHLLGYDHETNKEAEMMESLEISILAGMGIANPYETS